MKALRDSLHFTLVGVEMITFGGLGFRSLVQMVLRAIFVLWAPTLSDASSCNMFPTS